MSLDFDPIPASALRDEAARESGLRIVRERSAVSAEHHCNLIGYPDAQRFEFAFRCWLATPDGKLAVWEAGRAR